MRIGIDGYNLAMPNGTGVAVYGMMLGDAIRAGGRALDGLFGIDVGRDERIRETLFFDAIGRPPPPTRRRRFRKQRTAIADLARIARGVRPVRVPLSAAVEKQAFAGRLPTFDRLWSAPRLFETAERYFRLTGRLMLVSVADPPAVMHWTYPVPVRLAGARNIYTLHDLVPLKLPYTTLDAKRRYHALVAACIAAADRVCTVSTASRDDIVSLLDVDAARIAVTWQASPPPDDALAVTPQEDARAIENVFGLAHRGYFLFFGAIEAERFSAVHCADRGSTMYDDVLRAPPRG